MAKSTNDSNITEQGIRAYLSTFLDTLESTSTQYLDTTDKRKLVHLSLLPAKITCYLSTQFGIAFEYSAAESTSIEVIRGSARVEDLLFPVSTRWRTTKPMFEITGPNNKISGRGASVVGAFPIRLTSTTASLVLSNTRFEIGQYEKWVSYVELFGDRLASNWTEEHAVSRAKDEILVALVQKNEANRRGVSIEEFIRTSKESMVLVLGSYDGPGEQRLELITASLARAGYVPVLLKDIPDHPHHDLNQKCVALGSVARFVVVDDSSPSGHLSEFVSCQENNWVTILMHCDGQRSSFMTSMAHFDSNVIKEFDYSSSTLDSVVDKAAQWAEATLKKRSAQMESAYPWVTNQ